jgi:uncharacterized LabA/DUF88 family protein
MKLNVYIDGFNFYYAAVKGTAHKWLDLREVCVRCFPQHTIHRIKYFTADVRPRPSDLGQPNRQKAYLSALQTLPGLTIHKGKFKAGTRREPLAPSEPGHPRTVEVMYSEEKGSDVNLATELLMDAFRKDFEGAVIISDDSDLIAPIRAVRQLLHLPVGVLNPHPEIDPRTGQRRLRKDLERSVTAGDRRTALIYAHLDHNLLAQCQLPDPVVDARTGRKHFKPKSW